MCRQVLCIEGLILGLRVCVILQSLYNGPARGGNRGGKDQFNWDVSSLIGLQPALRCTHAYKHTGKNLRDAGHLVNGCEYALQSVKNDKDREFYLGHSVKASTGRHVHFCTLKAGRRTPPDLAAPQVKSAICSVCLF
jgi:hypothetical protein